MLGWMNGRADMYILYPIPKWSRHVSLANVGSDGRSRDDREELITIWIDRFSHEIHLLVVYFAELGALWKKSMCPGWDWWAILRKNFDRFGVFGLTIKLRLGWLIDYWTGWSGPAEHWDELNSRYKIISNLVPLLI